MRSRFHPHRGRRQRTGRWWYDMAVRSVLLLGGIMTTELTQEDPLDEATATKTPQQLQVQSLADQETEIKQQKKQLIARQALAKAQQKMRQANQASI